MIKKGINKLNIFRENNRGSVMVTVLIAFFFVSILAAVILSTVTVNMRMKGIDRKTKDEFYYVEKAFNDVYNGIGKECSDIMGESYNEVMTAYEVKAGKKEADAYDDFVLKFVTKFDARINKNDADAKKEAFNKYIVKNTNSKVTAGKTGRAEVKTVGSVIYCSDSENRTPIDIKDSEVINSTTGLTRGEDNKKKVRCIVIKKVNIISDTTSDENTDYVSELSADIVIDVPRVSFFTLNKEIYNYALLTNYGLECEPGSVTKITGNVYAGTMPYGHIGKDEKLKIEADTETYEYGGIYVNGAELTFNGADYVVSGGDIYIDGEDGSKDGSGTAELTINGDNKANTQIWFENLNVKGKNSVVNINGDLYAANDLEVNGDESSVTISGGYYGYNDGKDTIMKSNKDASLIITTKEAKLNWFKDNAKKGVAGDDFYSYLSDTSGLHGFSSEDKTATSSSIIVNAQNATLDMSNLHTLLLEGTAYINHDSKMDYSKKSGAYITEGGSIKSVSDDNTIESVALKSSQNAFLVPQEFIQGTSNPTLVTRTGDPFAIVDNVHPENNTKVEIDDDWFAKELLNETSPYKFVILKRGDKSYAYAYLNFKDESEQTKYLETIAASTEANPNAADSVPSSDEIKNLISPTAYDLKKSIEQVSALYGNTVTIGHDTSTTGYASKEPTRIFSAGSIMEFDNVSKNISVKGTNNASSAIIYHNNRINLYNRYRVLDAFADPLENVNLSREVKSVAHEDLFADDSETCEDLPIGRFFWISGIRHCTSSDRWCTEAIAGSRLAFIRSSSDDTPVELCNNMTFTECKVSDNGTIDESGTVTLFGNGSEEKVFLIVDSRAPGVAITGNIKIRGFLASKGKVTVKDNARFELIYDSTLINKRVNEELNMLTKANTGGDNDVFNDTAHHEAKGGSPAGFNNEFKHYLIYYLLDPEEMYSSENPYTIPKNKTGGDLNNKSDNSDKYVTKYRLIQNITGSGTEKISVNTDYNKFMYYENWKKRE